jgi:2-oxoisovalerate dehydrogenase E1 component
VHAPLPVVYVVQDNGYAISVPIEAQTAGGSISNLASGFPSLHIVECDGTDLVDSYRAAGEAIDYTREPRRPSLIHAHCTRPYSHSMSDDERAYRTEEERAAQDARDPLTVARAAAVEVGAATADELDEIEACSRSDVAAPPTRRSSRRRPSPPRPCGTSVSEDVDPTSSPTSTPRTSRLQERPPPHHGRPHQLVPASEMARDPRIVVFGQDVADATREGRSRR